MCINTYVYIHEGKSWVCSALQLKVKAACRNARQGGDFRQGWVVQQSGPP